MRTLPDEDAVALRRHLAQRRELRRLERQRLTFAASSRLVDRIIAGRADASRNGAQAADLALLDELCDTMFNGSLCGLGGLTPFPVRSALKHFREDFQRAT